MFKNIGIKIMKLAECLCWLGIYLSIISGIACISIGIVIEIWLFLIYGIILIILGPIFSWIGSFVLYGFGRLVENSEILVNKEITIHENNINQKTEQKTPQDDNSMC